MQAILGQLHIEVLPLPSDAPEPEENGTTFAENAFIKAESAWRFTGLPAIADDSGICVDALGGAPGVYSARYCTGSDEARNDLLLKNMEAVPDGQRGAHYACAICCLLPQEDGTAKRVEAYGECRGTILRERHGTGGFGYDPLFYVDNFGCTFGELPADTKNTVSHRGRALQQLAEKLRALV
jgi:XTP/dITP diphosphohydrolase